MTKEQPSEAKLQPGERALPPTPSGERPRLDEATTSSDQPPRSPSVQEHNAAQGRLASVACVPGGSGVEAIVRSPGQGQDRRTAQGFDAGVDRNRSAPSEARPDASVVRRPMDSGAVGDTVRVVTCTTAEQLSRPPTEQEFRAASQRLRAPTDDPGRAADRRVVEAAEQVARAFDDRAWTDAIELGRGYEQSRTLSDGRVVIGRVDGHRPDGARAGVSERDLAEQHLAVANVRIALTSELGVPLDGYTAWVTFRSDEVLPGRPGDRAAVRAGVVDGGLLMPGALIPRSGTIFIHLRPSIGSDRPPATGVINYDTTRHAMAYHATLTNMPGSVTDGTENPRSSTTYNGHLAVSGGSQVTLTGQGGFASTATGEGRTHTETRDNRVHAGGLRIELDDFRPGALPDTPSRRR